MPGGGRIELNRNGKEIVIDNNRITIDGSTTLTYSDDARRRFEGYGWQVLDLAALARDAQFLSIVA